MGHPQVTGATRPVVFPSDSKVGKGDPYDYRILRYLLSVLQSPFDEWVAAWTKRRQPHSGFKHVGRNDPCPCESGLKYKKCCLQESGVLRPHLEFSVGVPIPPGIPNQTYLN